MLKLFKFSNESDGSGHEVGEGKKLTRFGHHRAQEPAVSEVVETLPPREQDQNRNFTRFEHRHAPKPATVDAPVPPKPKRHLTAVENVRPLEPVMDLAGHLYSDAPIPIATLRNALPLRLGGVEAPGRKREPGAE